MLMEQREYIMVGKRSKKHNKILNFVMLLLITIFLVSCTSTISVDNDTKIEDKKEKTSVIKEQDGYYKLLLRFGSNNNPQPSDLFAQDEFLNDEKKINLDLNQNYDYIELKFQPLYYIGDYIGKKNFAISEDTINQEVNTGLEIINATDLKTMQIGERLLENFSMEMANGRNFNSEDFIVYNENQTINVILGNNYVNEYNLNDVLNLELVTKNMKFKIIGFLEKNTIMIISSI